MADDFVLRHAMQVNVALHGMKTIVRKIQSQQPVGFFSFNFAETGRRSEIAQETQIAVVFGAIDKDRENQAFRGFYEIFAADLHALRNSVRSERFGTTPFSSVKIRFGNHAIQIYIKAVHRNVLENLRFKAYADRLAVRSDFGQ